MRRNPDHVIAVYIVANRRNGTIYTGVTSDLARRIHEHRTGLIPGFTLTRGCKSLVWYERHDLISEAIRREKRLKKYCRAWKINLIEAANPHWIDLYNLLNN
jgi:putative endonuclease